MSWELLNKVGDVNACFELKDRFVGAIRALWMMYTGQQSQEEKDRLETKLEQLRNDIWKLMTTMPKMIDLLDSAEWQNHDKAVADLLPHMKDAVYNAQDLLDEFDYEEGARMSGQDHLHGDAFLEFFDKVKEIQGHLDHLHDQSMDLKLNEAPRKFNELVRPETSSFSREPKIFGRENELTELVQKLGVQVHTRKRKRNASKMTELPVLPIVGLGGIGKTTMAKQICNNAKVKGHFDVDSIIWLCVSRDFDIKRLIKEILQHFRQQTSSDILNVLMNDLARCVESKKFLLVLDDMWDDLLEDGERWKEFCAPLREGLQGSTILVTTRSPKVANLVDPTKQHYELKRLPDGVLWDFFKQEAFGSNSSCNDQELERLLKRKDILPKLKGNPLAAKTLGRLLKMCPSRAHWERILESELSQLEQKDTDILPILRLSYVYLPPHLKRCFSICALYPQDYPFEEEFLVDIWIAQGYVEPKDASVQFVELVNRAFFQKAGQTAHSGNKYVVHDLMHDMAQLVSKNECFIIRHASDLDKIPSNVRHLSIFTNGNVSCTELKIICDKKNLRSLVCDESFSRPNDFAPVIDCWFRRLLKIRVLSFKLSKVRELPESMGNAKHLRYLQLFGRSTFSTLPSSVRSLHHLTTVDARGCVFERFPQGFSDVISLQKFQSRNFRYKKDHCDRLCLEWSTRTTPVPSDQETIDQKEQMEALPHWNIQELEIKDYKVESFPSWLRPNLLPRLRSLKFSKCDNIQSISFFEPQGPVSLSADSPYRIEASSSSLGAFSSLASLTVIWCQGLLSLDEFLTPDYLPVIKHINVRHCDELTSLPVDRLRGFSRLQELCIQCCPKLNIHRVMTLPSCLKKLKLWDCPSIESIEMGSSPAPALEHLYINQCPDLRSIGGSIALAQIGSVRIEGCPGLTEVEQPFQSLGYTYHD